MLAIILTRAKEVDQVKGGGATPTRTRSLYILQYADNMVIFMDQHNELAENMKLLICAFAQLL
jgi:hypothetical protein